MALLSKTKLGILKIFFTNTQESYYLHEIGRMLNKKPGTFQRAINQLVDEKYLNSEYRANARYFWANQEHPLFNELKSIIFKTTGIQGSLKEALKKIANIHLAYIYGSFAKDQETPHSDVDVLIVGNPDENQLIQTFDDLEKILDRDINYNIYTVQEFQKNKDNPFLKEVLSNQKIILIGDENEI